MLIAHSHNAHNGLTNAFQRYNTYTATWISTVETNVPQTDAWIPNTPLGYYQELEKVGVEVATPLSINNPQAKLRPVVDMSVLYNCEEVILKTLSFHCLDVKKIGSEIQNAETNTAITNSLSSNNNALVQTRFINSVPPDWQPNFFRPKCMVDNVDILGNFASKTNFGVGNNAGDLSIGMPLPLSYEFYQQAKNIQNMEIYGLCYQYIPSTNLFKRYAIVCHADFWYR
jgi:hypothetical protein